MAHRNSLAQSYSCWPSLKACQRRLSSQSLQVLFVRDPQRAERYGVEAAGLRLDFSRNHLDDRSLALMAVLWKQAGMPRAIKNLISGAVVNHSEARPAWHTALRNPRPPGEVAVTLKRMEALVTALHAGQWRGYSGKAITDVVNIGIGGSDLGPRMATSALAAFHQPQLHCHFVSNIDPEDMAAVLSSLNPATTLFVVTSKSFTTLETLSNAHMAREWFCRGARLADMPKHFVAVTHAAHKAESFGIPGENIFPLWDWVGGRYSLWSAVGLPTALACGMDHFKSLLRGAHAMDLHFSEAPLPHNMPGMLGLLEIWYSHFFKAHSHAVLPYSHPLRYFPEFLQQLEMESNGKSVTRHGKALTYPTAGVVWGAAGSNGQHSFHQLLHQGPALIPVDFILPLKNGNHLSGLAAEQHRQLVANCLAQSEALLSGLDLQTVKNQLKQQGLSSAQIKKLAPHKVIPGNRPHNIISMDILSPETLGALVALYEHKVYVQSVVLDINAFDQWGVELGKQLSQPVYEALGYEALGSKKIPLREASLQKLVERFRELHS